MFAIAFLARPRCLATDTCSRLNQGHPEARRETRRQTRRDTRGGRHLTKVENDKAARGHPTKRGRV